MAHTLHALLALIDAEHDHIDALNQRTQALIDAGPADHPSVRDVIRALLHDAIHLLLMHFQHEHEAMHRINAPRNYIEAHAIEHDAMMTQLRIIAGRFQEGDALHAVLAEVAQLHESFARHRAGADAELYRYLRAFQGVFQGA